MEVSSGTSPLLSNVTFVIAVDSSFTLLEPSEVSTVLDVTSSNELLVVLIEPSIVCVLFTPVWDLADVVGSSIILMMVIKGVRNALLTGSCISEVDFTVK